MKAFQVLLLLGLGFAVLARPQETEGDAPAGNSVDSDSESDEEESPVTVEPTAADEDDEDLVEAEERRGTAEEPTESSPETPDAPAEEIPEPEALDFDAIQDLVYQFTNFSSAGFDITELLKRITDLESHVLRTSKKLSRELELERTKFTQLSFLLLQIREIKSKLTTFEANVKNLAAGVSRLGGSEPLPGSDMSSGPNQRAWATLYRSRGHSGRTTELDFRSCSVFEECCKNLQDLDNDSQSIHTHDTCVTMYEDQDCRGESRDFYPGSSTNHQDFGSLNDRFTSGKPCNRS